MKKAVRKLKKNMKRNRPLCLRVSEPVREALKAYSQQAGISQNQILEFLLRDFFQLKEYKKNVY